MHPTGMHSCSKFDFNILNSVMLARVMIHNLLKFKCILLISVLCYLPVL